MPFVVKLTVVGLAAALGIATVVWVWFAASTPDAGSRAVPPSANAIPQPSLQGTSPAYYHHPSRGPSRRVSEHRAAVAAYERVDDEPDEEEFSPQPRFDDQSGTPIDPLAHEHELAAYREKIDALFEAESVDRPWAEATTRDLESTVQEAGADAVRVAFLKCHTRLCKVELSFERDADPRSFMDAVAGRPGFHLPGFAHLVNDVHGGSTVHVFIARTDGVLPEPPY